MVAAPQRAGGVAGVVPGDRIAVVHLDLALVTDVPREAVAVVAELVGLEVQVGMTCVGGGHRSGQARRAVPAVEGRDLGADGVGPPVVREVPGHAAASRTANLIILGGDEGGVAIDGRRREEEEGVGGEGLERHNDAQNNSERGRRGGRAAWNLGECNQFTT